MPDDKSETVSWWTPLRWEYRPPTDEYAAYLADVNSASPDKFGYIQCAKYGNADELNAEIVIWSVPHNVYWFIEVFSEDAKLADFFVVKQHQPAFVVDKLPSLIHGYGLQISQNGGVRP